MTVWIEQVLIQNFLVDYGFLRLAVFAARGKVKKRRTAICALVGAGVALVFPVLFFPDWLTYALKLLLGVLLGVCNGGKKGKKFLSTVFFFLFVFAFGGVCYWLQSSFFIEEGSLLIWCLCAFPVLLVVLYWVLKKCIFLWRQRQLLYSCLLTCGKNKVEVTGLYDTGNRLYYRGQPVCLVDRQTAYQLNAPFEGAMQLSTATGSGVAGIFRAELVIYSSERKNTIKTVYLAVSPQPLGERVQVILQPQVLGEGAS